jgi:hypothetical protein
LVNSPRFGKLSQEKSGNPGATFVGVALTTKTLH